MTAVMPVSRAVPAVLADLRSATAPAHARLERRIELDARLASPDAYSRLLARFLGFHEPVEAWLEPAAGALPGLDYAARRKAPLLRADLAALGHGATRVERFEPPPGPPSLGTALGVLYVLEGATLGGKVVGRRARRALSDPPAAFLDCYGDAVGARWRAFGALLDEHAHATPEMTAGAVWCFTAIEGWLCR